MPYLPNCTPLSFTEHKRLKWLLSQPLFSLRSVANKYKVSSSTLQKAKNGGRLGVHLKAQIRKFLKDNSGYPGPPLDEALAEGKSSLKGTKLLNSPQAPAADETCNPYKAPTLEEDLAAVRRTITCQPTSSKEADLPYYQIRLPGISLRLSPEVADKIVSRLVVLIGGA